MSNKTAAIIDGPWQGKHTKKTISIMVLQNSYSKQWTALSTIWRRKGWVVSNYAKNKDLSQNGSIM